MKIEIINWESDVLPEFPLDLFNPIHYNVQQPPCMVWENGTFNIIEHNPNYVTGIWNPLDYYSELYIKTVAEIYDTEQLLIGIDKEKSRFFAIIFLNPVELTNV